MNTADTAKTETVENVEAAEMPTLDEFMAHINDEVIPVAKALGYVVTLTPQDEYDAALAQARKMAGAAPAGYVAYPAWRYNPETLAGQIFDRAEDVPAGWLETPH